MKAIVVNGPGDMQLVERPMPEIKEPNQVLVKVHAAGICGSDVHVYHGSNPYAKYPVVLGHEGSGEVIAVGEGGQVLAKPGSVHPHKTFESQVYVLTKDEGGRHTPFFSNYRPQFYFRTTDVTGIITLPEGTEMCMPGDNVMMHVELLTPVAMEEGLRFAIREGGRTVGSGVVGKIIE